MPTQAGMIIGRLALALKKELRPASDPLGVAVPVDLLWPGAVGVLVVFESEEAARAALGAVKTLEVRWPLDETTDGGVGNAKGQALQKAEGVRPEVAGRDSHPGAVQFS